MSLPKHPTNLLDPEGRPVEATAGDVVRAMSDDNLVDHAAELSFDSGAAAELQRRVSERLRQSIEQLNKTVDEHNKKSGRHTRAMTTLTVVIVGLTVVLILQGFGLAARLGWSLGLFGVEVDDSPRRAPYSVFLHESGRYPLQAEYEAWRDQLPESLADSRTGS